MATTEQHPPPPLLRRVPDMAEDDPERYECLECIGRGSYGDVYRGIDHKAGAQVAIKVIDLEEIEDDLEDIQREISALAHCRSPFITSYFASLIPAGSSQLLIVMELLVGSVADVLSVCALDESCIAYILSRVLGGLMYLHGAGRLHRDIKAANILVSGDGAVKMSDFGVSGQLTGTLGYRRRTFVGTPYWMAPEVIESSEEGYSHQADIWSLGVTAIEMACGQPPHAELHPMRVLFIIPRDPPPSLEGRGQFSGPFKSFVAACLQKDPALRPSTQELAQHPFITGAPPSPPPQLLSRIADLAAQRQLSAAAAAAGGGAGGAAGAAGGRILTSDGGGAVGPGGYDMGTLPTWDFGTMKQQQQQQQQQQQTLRSGTQAAAAAAAAAAAGGGQQSSVALLDPAALSAVLGGTMRAGDMQRYMAATAGGGAATTSAGGVGGVAGSSGNSSSSAAYVGGTLPSGASAAGMGVGSNSSSSTGTIRSAAAGGGSGLQIVTGPSSHHQQQTQQLQQQQQKPVYARLPSLQQLSVDINALNPEASSAAGGLAGGLGGPVGSGGAAIPIMASRLVYQGEGGSSNSSGINSNNNIVPQSAAGAAGGGGVSSSSGVVLARVLLPALQSLQAPGGGAAAPRLQACLEATAASLQQLEQVCPGACSRLLAEALLQLQLHTTTTTAGSSSAGASTAAATATTAAAAAGGGGGELKQLRAAVDSMFGSSGATEQQQTTAAGGEYKAGGQQQQQPGRLANSSSSSQMGGMQQHQQQQQSSKQQQQQQLQRVDEQLVAGVGQLGPLGSYLMARWREDVARSAAVSAAQGTAQGSSWQL